MLSGELDLNIGDEGFQYLYMKFDTFSIREVLVGSKSTGEYHLKINGKSNLQSIVKFFKGHLPTSDIGISDPHGIINLEYPIYIIEDNPMLLASMSDVFSEINVSLLRGRG